ncbi:MAG: MFS transporter [Henriciella sp.]|nr:MFS transporter [Henriciella sp.]
MSKSPARLPLPRVLAFASVGIPLAAIGLPMGVFVAPMYAEQLGLGTATVGLVLMVLRFWDLGTDPIMGWLVDSRPTKNGRIKHWILGSVPVLMVGGFFVFIPFGDTVSPLYLAFWLAVLWLGFTMLQTPYASWVPMIASDYDDRSRLFMWREIMNTATLIALLLLPTLLAIFVDIGPRGQVAVMGAILLISLPLTVGLAARFVPDHPPSTDDESAKFSWPAMRAALSDNAFMRLLSVEVLIGISIAATGSTFLFAARDGFGVVDFAPVVLLLHFICGFAAMPGWTWLSRRTDKHWAVIAVCAWSSVTFLFYVPLSIDGGVLFLSIGAIVSGFGFGSAPILLRSMVADVIERNRKLNGESRAGLYYSLNSAAYKIGASFGIGIPYIMLELVAGYRPGQDNTPAEIAGLIWVFVGVPVAAYGLAALIMRNYPLTREKEAAIQAHMLNPTSDHATTNPTVID